GTHDARAVPVDDDRRSRAEPSRLPQLSLLRASGVVGVARESPRAQAGHRCEHVRSIRTVSDDEEVVDFVARSLALADREQQSLDPGAEADPRGRRAADRLDESVVAAATADGTLRADRLVTELEDRARGVIETAHERRLELGGDAVSVEVRAHLVEVPLALDAE